jgi:hypothetical protein
MDENLQTVKTAAKKRKLPLRRNNLYYIERPGQDMIALPSVTTILGDALPKKELLYWAARGAGTIALENPNLSLDQVITKLFKRRDDAADLGKAVHAWAEAYALGKKLDTATLSDKIKPYIKAFEHFMEMEQPQIMYTECTVYNLTHGYAGTADMIALTKSGKLAIFDYKTGKNTYFDGHLQQEAYANAEYLLTKDHQIIPMPKIEEKYLVHLKDNEKYNLIDVSEPFESFLTVMQVWKILKKKN